MRIAIIDVRFLLLKKCMYDVHCPTAHRFKWLKNQFLMLLSPLFAHIILQPPKLSSMTSIRFLVLQGPGSIFPSKIFCGPVNTSTLNIFPLIVKKTDMLFHESWTMTIKRDFVTVFNCSLTISSDFLTLTICQFVRKNRVSWENRVNIKVKNLYWPGLKVTESE